MGQRDPMTDEFLYSDSENDTAAFAAAHDESGKPSIYVHTSGGGCHIRSSDVPRLIEWLQVNM